MKRKKKIKINISIYLRADYTLRTFIVKLIYSLFNLIKALKSVKPKNNNNYFQYATINPPSRLLTVLHTSVKNKSKANMRWEETF